MKFFEKNKADTTIASNVQLSSKRSGCLPFDFDGSFDGNMPIESKLKILDSIRQSVPIIDASIGKLVRLLGEFAIKCDNKKIEKQLNDFLINVNVGAFQSSVYSFIYQYFEQLLVYGTAVGEIVINKNGEITSLYNADLSKIRLTHTNNPINCKVGVVQSDGSIKNVVYPQRLLITALNPKPNHLYGVSILEGLPFVTSILVRIFNTIGVNWERVGNMRFAVNYIPPTDSSEKSFTKERAEIIANEWSKAMANNKNGEVSDFVSVGDVRIKVIGADSPNLDSQIPVKQMLEQIVSKLSIPPFLLGLSWSTTERMASQQVDLLTSEMEYYRKIINPTINKICKMWLNLKGYDCNFTIEWNDISLQDELSIANAELLRAKTKEVEKNI